MPRFTHSKTDFFRFFSKGNGGGTEEWKYFNKRGERERRSEKDQPSDSIWCTKKTGNDSIWNFCFQRTSTHTHFSGKMRAWKKNTPQIFASVKCSSAKPKAERMNEDGKKAIRSRSCMRIYDGLSLETRTIYADLNRSNVNAETTQPNSGKNARRLQRTQATGFIRLICVDISYLECLLVLAKTHLFSHPPTHAH